MKDIDSWDSKHRKEKFYYNQWKKASKKAQEKEEKENFTSVLHSKSVIIPKSIAIMLDLDGTSNRIDATTAKVFMEQVNALRKQFGNEYAYICISTHSHSCEPIKRVMDELNAFVTDGVILSRSFYYGGMYDYVTDSDYYKGVPFNMNKLETFRKAYIYNRELNIGWFALIDDTISESVYKKYQNNIPMVVLKPGCSSISKYNNFMYRETKSDNIYGVIELMDGYIKDIKGMDLYDILEEQEDMIRYLSYEEIDELIKNRQFLKLLEYLKSGLLDQYDFKNIYRWLMIEYDNNPFGKEYDSYMEQILEILRENGAFDKPEWVSNAMDQALRTISATEGGEKGISRGEDFAKNFMQKLENGEFKKDTFPEKDEGFAPTEEAIEEKLASYKDATKKLNKVLNNND